MIQIALAFFWYFGTDFRHSSAIFITDLDMLVFARRVDMFARRVD